ncbi:acyl-CoA dehydrogenase family protein [Arthrobacter sp. efr-133-TYG-118]|uniref:acyl-CoA dehydrogenase family protein n=1 Tax=Arthrobacter sp. efr-133-TYG-118 TaxID=3040279 RepID=UPI00254D8CD2|nr:acyl-CoA dehydrogenase family protein [Arthrobacter sp. efr-133-TYG-118]
MGISFSLSEEQAQLREGARLFAENILSKVEAAIAPYGTPEERFNQLKPFYQDMVDAGFVNALVPESDGGTGMSSLSFALACEELARVDVNVPSAILGTGLSLQPIIHFGTPEQKKRFFSPFLSGQPALGALAFTESAGGANYASPEPGAGAQTIATRDGNEWVINGKKSYTTNGTGWNREGVELMTVLCRTSADLPPDESLAVIIIEKGTPGVETVGIIDTMGHRAVISPQIVFNNVRVPIDNMIGVPGQGQEIMETTFSWTGALIGAACVGRMRAAFDAAYAFAKAEKRSGPVPIIDYQNVGYMLADIKMKIEAARYLAWKAADQYDKTGGRDRELANISKVFNSELSVQAVYDAMRLIGVDAYSDLSPIPAIMQDVLCFPIYDGGNMGVRRRQMHEMMRNTNYDPVAVAAGLNSIHD